MTVLVRNRAAGALLVLVVAMIGGGYLKTGSEPVVSQAVVTGILTGAVYGLVAMGLTLIFGVLDIVNFAHGAFLMVALFITYSLVDSTGVNVYVALPFAVIALLLLGGALQHGVLNQTMGRPLENQLLITLGFSLLLINLALLFYGGDPHGVSITEHRFHIFGAVATLSRVIAFVGALALAAVLFFVLNRTRLGSAIRAVASNSEGAALIGIDVRRIYTATFAIGTACAGAAGMLVAPFTTITPNAGDQYTIIAFVVVVMGSKGNALGALVSGIVIGLVEQFGGVLVPSQSPLLGVFVVFVLVLFFRPEGLFGRSTA